MGLLSPTDEARLRQDFARMTRDVRLLFFTQTLECETCPQTRQILDELTRLSDRISIEEVNFILERERAEAAGIDRVPAIVVLAATGPAGGDGAGAQPAGAPSLSTDPRFTDTRMRFLGTPAGYEFVSLVQAVLLAGGGESRLSEATRSQLATVSRPMTMWVFTTPT